MNTRESFLQIQSRMAESIIGQCYDGTTLPLVGGFTIFSILTAFTMRWADSK